MTTSGIGREACFFPLPLGSPFEARAALDRVVIWEDGRGVGDRGTRTPVTRFSSACSPSPDKDADDLLESSSARLITSGSGVGILGALFDLGGAGERGSPL
jgi:hypothetical protein